ncbi:MAG: hypothetical protein N2C13_00160, partial [Chloroflexota bacterium]
TGWRNADYDAACLATQAALPGEQDYISANLLAQLIFANELPVIPLFASPIVVLARPDICGLTPDATVNLFWNIESLDYGEECSSIP